MICQIQFDVEGKLAVESVLNCGLSFNEIPTKRSKFFRAYFGGVMRLTERPVFTVEVFSESQKVKVIGNLHYYFNQGRHNANDFDFENAVKAINEICQILKISAKNATLRGFEFGINIISSFQLQTFFNTLLSLRTAIAEKDKDTFFELYRFNFTQFCLKIYNKGKMFGLAESILRIEIHIDKMQWIQKQIPSLITLSNLQDKETMQLLGKILYEMVEEVLIIEDLDNSLMNQKDIPTWRKIIESNSWKNINPDQRRRQKAVFNTMIEKFSASCYKEDLLKLVLQKLNFLLGKTCMILPSGKKLSTNQSHHDFTKWENEQKAMNLPLMLKGNIMAKDSERKVCLLEGSFMGKTGKFYIQNPIEKNKFAVYDSAEFYDKRLSLPYYLHIEEAEKDFSYFLPIDLNALTTVKI